MFGACVAKMNLSEEVEMEDYVNRSDKISCAEIAAICQVRACVWLCLGGYMCACLFMCVCVCVCVYACVYAVPQHFRGSGSGSPLTLPPPPSPPPGGGHAGRASEQIRDPAKGLR